MLSAVADNVFVATVSISETKINFINLLGVIPDFGMTCQQLMGKLTDVSLVRGDSWRR